MTLLPPNITPGPTHLNGPHFFDVRLSAQPLSWDGGTLVFGGSYGTGALSSEPCSGTYHRWTAYRYEVGSGNDVEPIWPPAVGCRADPVISADGTTVVVRSRTPGGFEAASPTGGRAMSIAVPGLPTDLPTPTISRKGGRLAFTSESASIVSGDTNAREDAFILDWPGVGAERVSVDSDGVEGNGHTRTVAMSAGGTAVFSSAASNLVGADTTTDPDLYRRRLSNPEGLGLFHPVCCAGFDSSRPLAGDPVDAASGNFVDTTLDLAGPPGTTLGLARTYNSFNGRVGVFGLGWTSLFDVRMTGSGQWVDVTLQDGRVAGFEADGVGGWIRPERLRADLVDSGGMWSLEWDDGRVWDFDGDGRLATLSTPAGETIEIVRDGTGLVTAAVSSVGGVDRYSLEVNYTTAYPWQGGSPLVESVSDSEGRAIDFLFTIGEGSDESAPLVARVGNPRSEAAQSWSAGWWQHTYDAQDRLTRFERTVDASLASSSPSVRTRLKVENTYDQSGRVIEQLNPDGTITVFEYGEGTTTVTDSASGDETTYLSDDDGRQVGVSDALLAGLVQSWNVEGFVSEFTDRAGATSRMLYDSERRLRVRLLPDPVTGAAEEPGPGDDWTNVAIWATRYESWDYGASGGGPTDPRVTAYRNPAGEVTTYSYTGAAVAPSTMTTAAGTALAATTTFTYADGAATGQLESVTTSEGIETTFTYGTDGRIDSRTAGGRTTAYDFVSVGEPGWEAGWATLAPTAIAADRVTTPGPGSALSRTTTTLLNSAGQPVVVIDPFSGTGESGHHPVVTEYNDLGEAVSVTDESGAETTSEVRYSTDRVVPRDPDAACGCGPDPGWSEPSGIGSVAATTDADGVTYEQRFSLNGDLVEERLEDGAAVPEVTRHVYGELGRRVRTEVDAGTAAAPTTIVTSYGYDANGRPTLTTDGPILGVAELTTTLVYDKLGRVVEELGPTGDTERHHAAYTYDALGRVVTETRAASDPDAAVMSTWRYDAAGRVVETVTFLDGYADADQPYPALSAHQDALVTRYAYDEDGRRLVEVTGPANAESYNWPVSEPPATLVALPSSDPRRVTRYSYDPDSGELTDVTRPDGTVVTTTYDAAGRTYEVTETAVATSGTPPTRLLARYEYDVRGRVAHEWVQWDDELGSPDEVVVDRTWTPTGLLATETSPHVDGAPPGDISTVSMSYTAAGRLLEARDALGHRVSYDYELGRRTSRQVWDAADTSVLSQQTWSYTRDGQVATVSAPHAPGDPSPAVTSYAYDSRGRLVTRTDATGHTEQTAYNSSGQPAAVTWSDGPTDPTPTAVAISYDGAGRRTAASGTLGSYSWAYDRADRLVESTYPGSTGPETDRWRWDLAGNVVWQRHHDGRRTRYQWDDMGRLGDVAIDIAEEPDPPAWFPVADYGRDGFGQTVRESLVAGVIGQRTWERDLTGRIRAYDETLTPGGGPTSTRATDLTWRPDGRLLTEATAGEPTWTYDYDSAGQLTEADPSTGVTLEWAYGISGQRTTSVDATGTTTYAWDPGSSQLDAVTTPAGVRMLTYDAAGRRLTDTWAPTAGSPATTTYAYDDTGRLATVTSAAGVNTRGYDIDGQLVSYTTAPISGSPLALALHWDATAAVPRLDLIDIAGTLLHLSVGESILAFDGDGSVTFPAMDVRRSITTPTTATDTYDPFGVATPPVEMTVGYRSNLTLDGLVHLADRDYDPTIGAFTTHDPLDGIDTSPTNGNPYHYTDNDPLNYIDPTGRCRMRDGDFVVAANSRACGAARDAADSTSGCQLPGDDEEYYVWDPFHTITYGEGGTCRVRLANGGRIFMVPNQGCRRLDFWRCDLSGPSQFARGFVECLSGGIVDAGALLEDQPEYDTRSFTEAEAGCVTGIAASFGISKVLGPGKRGAATPSGAADDVIRGPGPRGGESTAAARGRQAHQSWDYGPGFEREFRLPSGRRVDGINFQTRQVVELKPNNPRAIRDGQRQLDRYLEELNREYPGAPWTGRVETYNP